jgi:PAS domain S-box-containing protein
MEDGNVTFETAAEVGPHAWSVARRYGLALLLAASAAALSRIVPASAARDVVVLLAFPTAALVAAWCGGTAPGLVAAVLGLVSSALLVFPPLGSMAVESPKDRALILTQAGLSVLLSLWVGALRHARHADALCAQVVARSEHKHRLIFERNPEPMAILEAATLRFLAVNQAMVDRYGYTKDEFLARRVFDLLFPEDVPLSIASLERGPRSRSVDLLKAMVWRHRTKSGAPIHVDVTATPIEWDGRDCALMLARDVTELVRATAAMRDAEEKWRALLESSNECFLVVDENDRIGFASGPLPGRPVDQLRNGRVSELVVGDDAPVLHESLETVRRTGAPTPVEVHVPAAEGRTTVLEGRCLPIKRDHGTTMVLLVLADVTRRREEEKDLRAAKDAADAANRAKDRFIAALSHELRTPLTPVLAAASLGQARHPDEAALFGVIRRNVEIEARLIDDLLDTSRLVCGKLAFEPRLVDMHSVVHRVLALCKPEAEPKQLRLNVELRASQPWVWVDHLRIEQALWNIVQNAVKFTPHGGTITVRSKDAPEGCIALTVADTGPGIAKEDLARIFRPFEQIPDVAAGRGLGLGLAISKGILDAAGGKLTAESDGPRRGTAFTIELPVHARVPAPKDRESPLPRARPGHLTILLVEDDVDTRETLQELLRASDCEVETAGTVSGALHELEARPFDLVITDLGLPDGSGLDLLSKAKALRPTRAIALSGYGMPDDLTRSKAAGFSAHLTKPVSLEKLMTVIRDVMA